MNISSSISIIKSKTSIQPSESVTITVCIPADKLAAVFPERPRFPSLSEFQEYSNGAFPRIVETVAVPSVTDSELKKVVSTSISKPKQGVHSSTTKVSEDSKAN